MKSSRVEEVNDDDDEILAQTEKNYKSKIGASLKIKKRTDTETKPPTNQKSSKPFFSLKQTLGWLGMVPVSLRSSSFETAKIRQQSMTIEELRERIGSSNPSFLQGLITELKRGTTEEYQNFESELLQTISSSSNFRRNWLSPLYPVILTQSINHLLLPSFISKKLSNQPTLRIMFDAALTASICVPFQRYRTLTLLSDYPVSFREAIKILAKDTDSITQLSGLLFLSEFIKVSLNRLVDNYLLDVNVSLIELNDTFQDVRKYERQLAGEDEDDDEEEAEEADDSHGMKEEEEGSVEELTLFGALLQAESKQKEETEKTIQGYVDIHRIKLLLPFSHETNWDKWLDRIHQMSPESWAKHREILERQEETIKKVILQSLIPLSKSKLDQSVSDTFNLLKKSKQTQREQKRKEKENNFKILQKSKITKVLENKKDQIQIEFDPNNDDFSYICSKLRELEKYLLSNNFSGDRNRLNDLYVSLGIDIEEEEEDEEEKEKEKENNNNEEEKEDKEMEKLIKYRANPVLFITEVLSHSSLRAKQFIDSLKIENEKKNLEKEKEETDDERKKRELKEKKEKKKRERERESLEEKRLRDIERKERLRSQLKKSYLISKSKKLLRSTISKCLASYLISLSLHPIDTINYQLQIQGIRSFIQSSSSSSSSSNSSEVGRTGLVEVCKTYPNVWTGVNTLNRIWLWGTATQLILNSIISFTIPYIHSSNLSEFRDNLQIILPKEKAEIQLSKYHNLQLPDEEEEDNDEREEYEKPKSLGKL